jgi:hypothetical protein
LVGKFQIGQFDFSLIPVRKQSKNQGPFEGSTPLRIKNISTGEFFIRVRWLKFKISVFLIEVFNLILGKSFEIQFLAIFCINRLKTKNDLKSKNSFFSI